MCRSKGGEWLHAAEMPMHKKADFDIQSLPYAHAGTGLTHVRCVYHSCTLNSLASVDAEFVTLAQTTNTGTFSSFPDRTHTSLVLLHTTCACASKP